MFLLRGGIAKVQRRTFKKNVICPEWGRKVNKKQIADALFNSECKMLEVIPTQLNSIQHLRLNTQEVEHPSFFECDLSSVHS
jgi:hypothetical protein